jgi:hypothetical protein
MSPTWRQQHGQHRSRFTPVCATLVALTTVFSSVVVLTTTSGAGAVGLAGSVKLGVATAINNEQVITQGPNGDIYFAEDKTVKIVKGLASPATFLHASALIIALDATTSSLFVETQTSISEYALPSGSFAGSWNLPSGIAPSRLMEGGISVVGSHLWTWTDWETDESGYEYSSVTEFNTSTWSSTVIAKNSADPTDDAASSLGYFYLNRDRFVRGEPSGKQLRSAVTADASDAPVATWGATAWIVATREPSGTDFLDTYNATTMVRTNTAHLAHETWGILGTSGGLLAITTASSSTNPALEYVVSLNDHTGSATDLVKVPNAVTLLAGPTVAVVVQRGADIYIDRLT